MALFVLLNSQGSQVLLRWPVNYFPSGVKMGTMTGAIEPIRLYFQRAPQVSAGHT